MCVYVCVCDAGLTEDEYQMCQDILMCKKSRTMDVTLASHTLTNLAHTLPLSTGLPTTLPTHTTILPRLSLPSVFGNAQRQDTNTHAGQAGVYLTQQSTHTTNQLPASTAYVYLDAAAAQLTEMQGGLAARPSFPTHPSARMYQNSVDSTNTNVIGDSNSVGAGRGSVSNDERLMAGAGSQIEGLVNAMVGAHAAHGAAHVGLGGVLQLGAAAGMTDANGQPAMQVQLSASTSGATATAGTVDAADGGAEQQSRLLGTAGAAGLGPVLRFMTSNAAAAVAGGNPAAGSAAAAAASLNDASRLPAPLPLMLDSVAGRTGWTATEGGQLQQQQPQQQQPLQYLRWNGAMLQASQAPQPQLQLQQGPTGLTVKIIQLGGAAGGLDGSAVGYQFLQPQLQQQQQQQQQAATANLNGYSQQLAQFLASNGLQSSGLTLPVTYV